MYRHILDPTNNSFSVEKNGQPLDDVVWADDTIDQACIYAHDRNGNRILDTDSRVGYETVMVSGKIKITDLPRPTPAPDPQPSLDLGWYGPPC